MTIHCSFSGAVGLFDKNTSRKQRQLCKAVAKFVTIEEYCFTNKLNFVVSCVAGNQHLPSPAGEEAGTAVSQLQLEPEALQNVLDGCSTSGEGVTPIRLNPGSVLGAVETASEAGYVCKACRLAFSHESAVLSHQKICGSKGCLRLIRSRYSCTRCDTEVFQTIQDFQRHFETSHPSDPALAPSPGLSHEMEDVVNQITALAAKAAAQSPPDSNANIFCPPPEPKKPKMFHSLPVPSAGQ